MTTSNESRRTSTSRTKSSPGSTPRPATGRLILGIDPGSRATGYGLIRADGSRIRYETSGVIAPSGRLAFPDRLLTIYEGLRIVLDRWHPDEVAVETAFVRKSASAALQIGHARGVALLAARQSDAILFEYTAPEVKLAVVQRGAASKAQVSYMVRRLLPAVGRLREDEADALAVALCHANRAAARSRLGDAAVAPGRRRTKSRIDAAAFELLLARVRG